jgi:hypothetical protein
MIPEIGIMIGGAVLLYAITLLASQPRQPTIVRSCAAGLALLAAFCMIDIANSAIQGFVPPAISATASTHQSSPLIGLSEAQARQRFGKPQSTNDDKWYYDSKTGTTVLTFSGGVVVDVHGGSLGQDGS